MTRQDWIIGAIIAAMIVAVATAFGLGHARPANPQIDKVVHEDYLRAIYHPLHFKPAALTATDEQCLACHREVIDDRVRAVSPAGVKASDTRAWYQQVATYAGDQETFHRRHLETPLAKALMKLRCNTCHEGLDPRDEAQGTSADGPQQNDTGFTLRKQVNPETTCLKCHGQMSAQEVMGLAGPWPEVKDSFQNNCLVCHAAIRTVRHQVDYLNAKAIEEAAAKQGGDVCYGCHGGRAWYSIAYPYPRHAWPNMPPETPAWAKDRPMQSEARFAPTVQLNRFLQPTP